MMAVENPFEVEDVFGEEFPVGMRVLAVDDDQTCLKLLEKFLLMCKYNVTTTTKPVEALELLREKRDMFDLVISDVSMPEMDGFKLLEQVGHEMDLPFIMLSGNDDRERVMKGVMKGACDYLVKPIRLEELKNIWQHVVRKKIESKDRNKGIITDGICSQDTSSENIANKNKTRGQKIKEQSEDEEEEEEEEAEEDDDGENDEECSTRKKPRLVWDDELHKKFVSIVSQLGLDKAYPKKIRDLMNVEGLTRENVASHLQKYKLSLKRPSKQARVDAALDPHLQKNSVAGYGDFCNLPGSRRILSSTLPTYASSNMFCRLNAPSGFNLRGMSSSALVPPLQSQNIPSYKQPLFFASESSSALKGARTSVEINQFQQNIYPPGNMNLSPIGNSSAFTDSSGFQDIRANVNNANSFLSCISSNHLQTHNSRAFINHPSVGGPNMEQKSFNPSTSGSYNFASNPSPLSEDFNNDQISHNSLKFASLSSQFRKSPDDFSLIRVIDVPLEETMQCQDGLLGNVVTASCYTQQQNVGFSFNNTLDSLASSNAGTNSMVHSVPQTNSPLITQMPVVEKFYSDERTMESNGDCFFEQLLDVDGFVQNSCLPWMTQ